MHFANLRSLAKKMLGGVLLCLCVILLASCENFMNGAETRNALQKLIEEANAPAVDVYLITDNRFGSLSPSGIVNCKINKPFKLFFTPADGYEFINWKVINRKTEEELVDVVIFENINQSETTATVIKEYTDIQIIPVCKECPKILSVSPQLVDSGVNVNTPIEIKFSQVLQNDDQTLIHLGFENITIKHNDEIINKYFNEPELLTDNKTLKIYPKTQELLDYINLKDLRILEISVEINLKQITLTQNAHAFPVYDAGFASFTYKVNKTLDNDPPVKTQLIIKRKNTTGNDYSAVSEIPCEAENTVTEFTQKPIVEQHRILDTLHIYANYTDLDSGVKGIKVKEKLLNDKEGNSQTSGEEIFIYEKNELNILSNDKNNLEFDFDYKLVSDDGCVSLEVCILDYCDNESKSINYLIIKDTTIGLDKMLVYNCILKNPDSNDDMVFDVDYNNLTQNLNYLKLLISTNLNNTTGDGWNYSFNNFANVHTKTIYKDFTVDPTLLNVECEYESAGGTVTAPMTIQSDSSSTWWGVQLNTTSVDSLKVKIKITDDIGNYEERVVQFPDSVQKIKKIEVEGQNKKIYFDYSSPWTKALTFTTSSTNCPSDANSSAALFYNSNNTTAAGGYYVQYNGFDQNVILVNSNQYCELASTPRAVKINSNIQTTNQSAPEGTVSPVAGSTVYSKSKPNSSKVYVTFTFDQAVWAYWDEINFQSSAGTKHSVVKNSTSYTFEDEDVTAYKNGRTIQMTGYKCTAFTQDSQGVINSIDTIQSVKDYNMPAVPSSCYTNAPLLTNAQYFLNNDSLSTQVNCQYFCPIKISCIPDIAQIVYWSVDGVRHVNEYISAYTVTAGEDKYFYYPAAYFFDRGDIYFTVTDVNGNTASTKITKTINVPCAKSITDGTSQNHYNVVLSQANENVTFDYVYFDNKKWNNPSTSYTNVALTDVELVKDKYLKIITHTGSDNYIQFSSPAYLYIDSNKTQNSGKGFLQDDNSGIRVTSDRPVFVHTVYTKTPKNICQEWDIAQWESYHKSVNETVLTFSDMDMQSKVYKLDFTALDFNDSYVVIAHFANGMSFMSTVRQK